MSRINEGRLLEWQVQGAYDDLDTFKNPRTLYLTNDLRLRWLRVEDHPPSNWNEVGTYRKDVHLDDLRRDVYHIYEGIPRRRHG